MKSARASITPMLALLAGAFVFLRVPFDGPPTHRPPTGEEEALPALPSAPARASAAVPDAPPPAPLPAVSALEAPTSHKKRYVNFRGGARRGPSKRLYSSRIIDDMELLSYWAVTEDEKAEG